jgi:biopolymer transport protein ExbB/TolQ
MLYFPDIANIDELRKALKGFAQSLGIAFNTTLLALAYTIVLIILTTVLKENERQLLQQLDELSSRFISRIKVRQ